MKAAIVSDPFGNFELDYQEGVSDQKIVESLPNNAADELATLTIK